MVDLAQRFRQLSLIPRAYDFWTNRARKQEMKPSRFQYSCPKTLSEAVALLASARGEAKLIAGGQSLMPVLAFRLAAPALLIDLRCIPDLDRIEIAPDSIRLGAKVRWRDIEKSAPLCCAHPLLIAAISHVAHYQIRNRGTVGGSLAHADPASEMPGIAVACDAEIVVTGPTGTRAVRAAEFFQGPLITVLEPEEIIVAVRLPGWRPGRRWGFEEFARRRGDFAIAAIALYYDEDSDGRAENAHVGVIGACNRPHRLVGAEEALNGHVVDARTIAVAARAAVDEVDPPVDMHASAKYRRALVGILLERALECARARQHS
jgi:CO/xanthine dehydrogenase FAD-binding subunit